MNNNFIDALIREVKRVVKPNAALLEEVLVIGGMPEQTQNLRYLSFNRHTAMEVGCACEFSAVAVINNRRAEQWQLMGYKRKVSRWIFSTRWTLNPLDLFLNNLRCDASVMAVLAGATANYSLLGILKKTDLHGTGLINRRARHISPVVAVPGIAADALKTIQAFESANRIKQSGIIGLQWYRKTGGEMSGIQG